MAGCESQGQGGSCGSQFPPKPGPSSPIELYLLNMARSHGLVTVESVFVDFPQDPAPVPLKLMVLAGAEQVEHDATETKFSELVLHKGLILFLLSIYPWLRLEMLLLTKNLSKFCPAALDRDLRRYDFRSEGASFAVP